MLPKFLRFFLRKDKDFFAEPKKLHSPHLLLFYKPDSQARNLTFAIIVKKTHGQATQRQQTRRRIYQAIQSLRQQETERFTLPYKLTLLVKGQPQTQQTYEIEIHQLLTQLA
jgi:ribonuclease P protein component